MSSYFTSDTHFWHGNILAYEPWRQTWARNVSDMNEVLIEHWNKVVTNEDTVYHLGDFCFGNEEMVSQLRKRLNGRIHVIIGNHDRSATSLSRCGVVATKNLTVKSDNGLVLHCRHDPRKFTANEQLEAACLLHGHLHGHPHHDGIAAFVVSKLVDLGVDATRRLSPLSMREVSELCMKKVSIA